MKIAKFTFYDPGQVKNNDLIDFVKNVTALNQKTITKVTCIFLLKVNKIKTALFVGVTLN